MTTCGPDACKISGATQIGIQASSITILQIGTAGTTGTVDATGKAAPEQIANASPEQIA